ncbi:hypothetical protein PILCRDRAFT_15710 [Piloderma croceum F 1598]|uniref:Uncharacterized protein n=1 Tax=Piloderma croceum (strain F 1598) TaxID=765440 RepID=A0A0C3EYT0_PILCF|nr:hypothetical protein PILCRDRAFT_15710 [Piloderma croceum F 1598]
MARNIKLQSEDESAFAEVRYFLHLRRDSAFNLTLAMISFISESDRSCYAQPPFWKVVAKFLHL